VTANDVTEIVNDAWPFISAAIAGYGAAVLKVSEDSMADATVSLGRRILQRVFGHGRAPEALAELTVSPEDADLQAALRVAVRKLLAEDGQLAAQVRDMVAVVADQAGARVSASNVISNSRIQGPVVQAGTITGDTC
jgi:hypothetical protein